MAAVHPPQQHAAVFEDGMMMNKLEIDDLASLVKFAIRHGVTSVE